MKRIVVFPIVKVEKWVFRTSVSDGTQIMLMAFGPENQYMLRFFIEELDAKAWIDEVVIGKHVE